METSTGEFSYFIFLVKKHLTNLSSTLMYVALLYRGKYNQTIEYYGNRRKEYTILKETS